MTTRAFHYCRICYRNFTDYEWKKHRFNPKHKQRLEDTLAETEVELDRFIASEDLTQADLDFDATAFKCYFCEDFSAVKNGAEDGTDNSPAITVIWKHLAGKKHKAQVQQYFAEYTPPALYQPHRYWLKKSALQYKLGLCARLARTRREGGTSEWGTSEARDTEELTRDTPATPNTDTTLVNRTLLEPSPEREARTVFSKDGIAQNPTGWHHGTRVWGGGIVRVRASEWRAWPIDLDEDASAAGEAVLSEAVLSEAVLGEAVLSEAAPYRTVARASKLAAIQVDPELAKIGNVHTGAAPPWESSEGTARVFGPVSRAKHKNPHRVGAEHANRVRLEQQGASEQPRDADPNWLPKFGRVFNAGSRSDSRKEFDQERKRKLDQR